MNKVVWFLGMLLFLTTIPGCVSQRSTGSPKGTWRFVNKTNGEVYSGGINLQMMEGWIRHERLSGCLTIRWENKGRQRMEAEYENGVRNGSFSWWDEGRLISNGNFKAGVEHGTQIARWPDGRIFEIENYDSGKLHGKWERWGSDGKQLIDGQYNNGQKNGKWTYWWARGVRFKEEEWENGVLKATKTW